MHALERLYSKCSASVLFVNPILTSQIPLIMLSKTCILFVSYQLARPRYLGHRSHHWSWGLMKYYSLCCLHTYMSAVRSQNRGWDETLTTNGLGKQQIKLTLMQEKWCNFIMWNLIALHSHSNLLFQASVSCLIRQRTQELSGEESKWPQFRRTELGHF